MRFAQIFQTSNGEFEINRVLGAFGTLVFIVATHIFMAWEIMYKGKDFDVTAYCLAFPGGLGVAVASIAGAVYVKDRGVATAKIINDTGAVPTPPPAGPPVDPNRVEP